MHRVAINLPLFALLGACTSQLEITQPPVPYKTVKQFPAQSYRGNAETTVRTSVKTADGTREVSGATCTLATAYTETQFQTPAHVRTANLGPSTPTANLKCQTPEHTAQVNLPATNISLQERSQQARASGAAGGIIGAIAGGIVAGINEGRGDRPGDVHGYVPVTLPLNSAEQATGTK